MNLATLCLSLLALSPGADLAPEAILYGPWPLAGQPGVLQMTWRADSTKPNVTIRAVTLQWADPDKLPLWRSIGPAEMANTGSYSWRVPAGVPDKVYLRLTVRDSDGRVSVAQSRSVRLPLRR